MAMTARHFLAGVCLLGFAANTVRGDFLPSLTADVSQTDGGLYRYDYTLTNPGPDGANAIGLVLSVSADSALSHLAAPQGWEPTYNLGDTAVSWGSASPDTDLRPGGVDHFSFLSPLPPTPLDYAALGFDPTASNFLEYSGQTTGPAGSAPSVPEPSTLLTLIVGVSVGFYRHRRQRSVRFP